MRSALKRLFSPSPEKYQVQDAYLCIVACARNPILYTDFQVADTLDGRFDAILLHLFLVIERCNEGDEKAKRFARDVSEAFFADMDRSLREMGASDTGVGKRIKNMVKAFYGRLKSYGEATDDTLLGDALRRNLYRDRPVEPQLIAQLIDYVSRTRTILRTQPTDALLGGQITFSS